jgi:hypothetical protein
MPKILERVVNQLKAKGFDESQAYAIGTKSLQKAGDLKAGTRDATAKGAKRGSMTPEAREKSRALGPVKNKK